MEIMANILYRYILKWIMLYKAILHTDILKVIIKLSNKVKIYLERLLIYLFLGNAIT